MAELTMGEIAFHETKKNWEWLHRAARKYLLRELKLAEVWAESDFIHLPVEVRSSLIEAWETQHLDRRVGT